MVKVVPYIETIGTEKFKKFLLSPFEWIMLINIFTGWEAHGDGAYINTSEKVQIELDGPHYMITKGEERKVLPIPKTLNDFINDMTRLENILYWSTDVLLSFEPKDMYSPEGIKQYYVELLNKMEKGHELL